MTKADTHRYFSLLADLTDQDLAREVATAAEITIDMRRSHWPGPGGTEDWNANKIGVYCETKEEAALFKRAFGLRRWEDGKSPGGDIPRIHHLDN